MRSNVPTPHIDPSDINAFAKTVIMPGDPLRAKFIADTYLEDVVEVTTTRNMLGYTGTYKGKRISVMGSGIGMPSMGIYSYELFKFYDVDNIIRIGSCGAFSITLDLYDVVIATDAYTNSNFGEVSFELEDRILKPSQNLVDKLKASATANSLKYTEGRIATTDAFYKSNYEVFRNEIESNNCLAVEMEAFALFANANETGKNAACLVTVSDHIITGEVTTSKEREKAFTNMMEIVLNADY